MAEINDLDPVDASNIARFPEGQAPSTLNNGAKGLEGLLARWVQHSSGENFLAISESGVNSLSVSMVRASFTNSTTSSKYIDGLSLLVTVPTTVTGPILLSIGGHTKKPLIGVDGLSLSSSSILGGQKVMLSFDADALSGVGGWSMLNPTAKPTAASATVSGVVELATTAETETGTDAGRAVTPDGLHDMTTLLGAGWLIDEDDMSTDSATVVPSQQSVKAYVDASVSNDLEFVSTAAFTAATAVVVTGMVIGYDYFVQLEAFSLTDDGQVLWMRFSDDDGVTYEAGAADYEWGLESAGALTADASDSQIDMVGTTMGNDAATFSTLEIRFINPNAASENTTASWDGYFKNTEAAPATHPVQGGATFKQGTDAVSAVQFLWSGGSTFKAQGDISVWRRKRS